MVNEIKRPNYFRSQFLVENDFLDEQNYQRNMRQRHFLALHEWGVLGEGLQVQTTANQREINISSGVAIDRTGREIVLIEPRTVTVTSGANTEIYLTVRYQEERLDSDRYSGSGADAINNYVRITENPQFELATNQPDENSDNILLAQIKLDANSNIANIDNSIRKYASSWIAPNVTLPGPIDINNKLSVTGNLTVGSEVDAANVSIPGGTLDVGTINAEKATFNNLTANNNIGIGTANPSEMLHLQSTGSTKILLAADTDNQNETDHPQVLFQQDGGTVSGYVGFGSGNENANHLALATTWNSPDSAIDFITQNTTRMTIAGNGNIGIGTTNPNNKLEISGTSGNLLSVGATLRSTANIDLSGHIQLKEYGNDGVAYLQARDDNSNQDIGLRIRTQTTGSNNRNLVEALTIAPNGDVGIGTTIPVTRLHVIGNATSSFNSPVINHVAFIENTATVGASVLALKLGNSGTIDGNNNYITFFRGNGTAAGAIDGGNNNSIRYQSGGGDYAEWLPRLQEDEQIEPGDIVGVLGGKVSKKIEDNQQIMAITDRPIVLGKMPDPEQKHLHEQVSFLGQIPVKVRGKVQVGDYIIPSGLNDGTGIAVSPDRITPLDYNLVVGKAWETSQEEGIKRINTIVGLPSSYPGAAELISVVQAQQTEIETLNAELKSLKMLLTQAV